jgi:hypothetical protein
MTKYHNRKTEIDGYVFDSIKESSRYLDLRVRLEAGEIQNMKIHPRFELRVGPYLIGKYTADFSYDDLTLDVNGVARPVVEDVKSQATITEAYRLREKLMLACHGITVQRVGVEKKPRKKKTPES